MVEGTWDTPVPDRLTSATVSGNNKLLQSPAAHYVSTRRFLHRLRADRKGKEKRNRNPLFKINF